MEVQSECVEPPVAPQCDPQPTGKINKAAFKLFGKRRTGSGMASFFSFRNKGATNTSVELVRSKTHDGLTSTNNDADGQRGEGLATLEAGPVRSLSKSLSFFSLLRRGSFRSSENGGAGLVRRGRGLKGFFSSMRWRRKEKTNEGDGEEVEAKKEKDGEVADSEKVKDITLTLEPPPHHHQEDCGNAEAGHNLRAAETPTTSVTMTPPHCVAMPGPSGEPDSPFPYTPTDSPLRPSIQKAKASISSLTPSLATPPLDRCSTGDPPSEPSVDRLCSLLFTDVTSLKSFDSLTGCGDIIADADEEGPVGNGGSGTSSSSSGGGGGTGSGVVAYMGGGEEMASPEGVDDADMQGLWHMLPSTGDNSPALPRSHQPSSTTPTSTYPPRTNPASSHLPSASRSADRKVPQVKALGLSKIPIVGGAVKPLSDEGYWDTPSATPTATPDESGLQRDQKMALSRDSCSGDHLYDLYNDPEEEGEDQEGDEDLNSSTSLPRESKIPVSNKQQTSPPHSISQSALSSVLEAESPAPKTQAPPPVRTRIPVSKVPVRRSGNKPGSTTRGASHKK
uniref:APC membrane recruitment protein 2 n=1 Tax=Stegastes partitus TaxID=144197 RepID=A0A3B4ZS12_9TELE